MVGGGAGNVGMGLGTGISEAMAGMRIARQDIKQGASPMQDPRIKAIYDSMTPTSFPGPQQGPTTSPRKY
jgi:hypothetical protein